MGVMEDRRRIIAAQPHLVTASGSAVLVDIAEPKVERLKVTFAPVQTGSGTPSPSNVRPIMGWSTIAASIGTTPVDISLGGTYYGGVVDLVSGELTVTHGSVITNGSTSGAAATSFVNRGSSSTFWLAFSGLQMHNSPAVSLLCNMFTFRGVSDADYGGAEDWTFTTNATYQQSAWFKVPTSILPEASLNGVKAWCAANNVQMVAPLLTPQTYQLTPQTILALRGQQTVTPPAGAVEISYWTH